MAKTATKGLLISVPLDKSGAVPIYQQIVERLREAIEVGRLPEGTKLPSTRIFADELGVSRNTVMQVFDTLTSEGYLASRVGAGTFVATPQAEDSCPASLPPAATSGHNTGYPFRSLSRRGKSLVRSASGAFSERPTPFMPDLPDLRQFPIRSWLRFLNETSGRLTGEILANTSNAGYEPLRRAIAQHLNASRGMACDYSQVIITTGSQQSLDLICRMLLDTGDPVWLEEPGYVGARAVIVGNGGALYPVPVDAHGLDVEMAMASHPAPRLVFCSPSRQYPLGGTLSMARREALAAFAHRSGAWIIEDDYDHEFRYEGSAPPAIHSIDTHQRTIHLGTFSKVLLPSFRLGYLVVPPDFAQAFAHARAVVDRHASLIEQMVLSEFMLRGLLVAHIRRMRKLYRARQMQLLDGLRALFGGDLGFDATDTGTHLILPLRSSADDHLLARHLAERGVVTRPLSAYYYTSGVGRRGLLLGFSAFTEAEIDLGLRRLSAHRDALNPCLAGRSAM